jgi:hypothetical protein
MLLLLRAMVSDVQMNASTLEVMRTPERRGSASAAAALSTPPPGGGAGAGQGEAKPKMLRRPSLRTAALEPAAAAHAEPMNHVAPPIRRGSGGSASADSLVAEALGDLNKEILLERDKYERLMIQVFIYKYCIFI